MCDCESCTEFEKKHNLSPFNPCNFCKYQLPNSPDQFITSQYFPKSKCAKCNAKECESRDFLIKNRNAKLTEIVNKNCGEFEAKA